MSLQPCLTVPKKGRFHRNKKKQENSNTTIANDDNESLTEGEQVDNIRLKSIDDLQSMDVTDYMASVRNEANEMPDVFVSEKTNTSSSLHQKNDRDTIIDGSAAACLYFCNQEAATKMTPIPISKDWMDGICHVFSQLRQYISTCHQAGVGHPPRRIPVPRSKNSLDWHIFCLGKNEAYGNANGYYDDESMNDGDDDDDKEIDSNRNLDSDDEEKEEGNGTNRDDDVSSSKNNSTLNTWDEKSVPPDGHIPTVSLLCQMDQVLTRRVLSHLLHYLIEGGWELTRNRGQWIYSLLARLEKPLHREECSLLYSLLKYLCQKRQPIQPTTWQNNKTKNDVQIITNTILVIIVVYFEQASPNQIFKMIT